jgi:geranylgeranyl diphosphate synthase, type II
MDKHCDIQFRIDKKIHKDIARYIEKENPVPPLLMKELDFHADNFSKQNGINGYDQKLIKVLINNEAWKKTLSYIPYDRRVLLLPMCLKSHDKCMARQDEFGLICQNCGNCKLGEIQEKAESLGYIVLIAEGTTVVTTLIRQGSIDCVIGVSCFETLQKALPDMISKATPGIGIPLSISGCKDTKVDISWLYDVLQLKPENNEAFRLDFPDTKKSVTSWFKKENLIEMLQTHDHDTDHLSISRVEKMALDVLSGSGKKYRPYITASVYSILTQKEPDRDPGLKKVAVAVECFHKASLVHDDIEDNDDTRYGKPTLHKKYGIPEALNAGDFLIGQGYSLLLDAVDNPLMNARMFKVAANGHRTLSMGQGEELYFLKKKRFPSSRELILIFKNKTAPAFEVALNLGAIMGNADMSLCKILSRFSKNIGIAYQIKDDIEDINEKLSKNDISSLKSSILIALSFESSRLSLSDLNDIREINIHEDVFNKAQRLIEDYTIKAQDSIKGITNINLKCLLHRILDKIL